jgi:uncharacterized protein
VTSVLLDVGVVIALLDDRHVFHEPAHRWAAARRDVEWLICPVVENGVLRVLSQPKYRNALATTAEVKQLLGRFYAAINYRFVPDAISLVADVQFADERSFTSHHVTDLYLVALAQHYDARFATFDTRIPIAALHGMMRTIERIPTT